MKLDRNNHWFRAGMAVTAACFLIAVAELVLILGRDTVPPEWTNWLLMTMPVIAMVLVLQSLRDRQLSDPQVRTGVSEGV
jgi:hypothetical protein